MRSTLVVCAAAFLLVSQDPAVALSSGSSQAESLSESTAEATLNAVEALALYPEDTRDAILGVCLYPQVVTALGELRAETSREFRGLLADLPREEQQKLWELVRFPELVDALAAGERTSGSEIGELAKEYPEEIRAAAEQLGRDHTQLVREIAALREQAQAAVDDLLEKIPLETQADFRKLLGRPEILSLLDENPELTRRLGDRYRGDPAATKQLLTDLGRDVAERNQEALDDWVRGLEEDPEAEVELREAAEEFANEQGIDTDEAPPPAGATTLLSVVHYSYAYPYPYWFGYPYWRPYAYWYPLPYYYHCGFYYGLGGTMVVIGLPSYAFVDWHFRHDYHQRYPHLSARYVVHVERHRRWRSGGSEPIRVWVDDNRHRLPKGWLRNDGQLARRFREYGRFEEAFEKPNSERPGPPVSRAESRRERRGEFATLSASEPGASPERKAEPSQGGRAEQRRHVRAIRSRSSERERHDRARDFHQGSWERSMRREKSRQGGRSGRRSRR